MLGTVKWYDPVKGYGFIKPDDDSKDIFLHRTALVSAGIFTITENERVSFDPAESKNGKGDKAINLKIITN